MQTEIEGDKDIIIFISIRTTSLDLYKLMKVIAALGCPEKLRKFVTSWSVSEIKWVKTTVTYLLPYNRLLSWTGIELLTLNGPEEPKIR